MDGFAYFDRPAGNVLIMVAATCSISQFGLAAAYWDLLTGLWRTDGPRRKTDALGLMKGIKSVHTAGKYLDTAIEQGIIVETDNPQDAR